MPRSVGAREKVENSMGDTSKRGGGHQIEPKFLPFHILLSKIPSETHTKREAEATHE